MNQPSLSARKPPTLRGKRTRQHLLDAAELVFGERGFEHTSISEITRRAGVALGTFYIYFPHKQAIFTELVDELGSRLRETLANAVRGASGKPAEGQPAPTQPVARLTRLEKERAGFKAFFEFAGKHRNLYRIVRQAEFVDEAVYHRYYRTLGNAYAKGLTQAIEREEIGKFDPEVTAYALMGIADMVGMRFVLWDDPEKLEAVVNDVFELIAHGLLSPQRLSKQERP